MQQQRGSKWVILCLAIITNNFSVQSSFFTKNKSTAIIFCNGADVGQMKQYILAIEYCTAFIVEYLYQETPTLHSPLAQPIFKHKRSLFLAYLKIYSAFL